MRDFKFTTTDGKVFQLSEVLKEKKAEMSVKEIESECAIMYARKNLANANFSKSNDGVMTAGLVDDGAKDGFIVSTRYGCIPVNR